MSRRGESLTTRLRRILVLRFGLLGDVVLLTPALRLLRLAFPDARIDVLATPLQREVLDGLPCIDRVVTWHARDILEPRDGLRPAMWNALSRSISAIRREEYDAVLSCYGELGSLVCLLSGAPVRIGFGSEALPGTLTHALPGRRWERNRHDAEYNADVIRALANLSPSRGSSDLSDPVATPPSLIMVSDANRAGAGSLLDHVSSESPVVLHPGATNSAAKRWPAENWITLSRRLRSAGRSVVVIGSGSADHLLGEQLVSHPGHNLVNRTSVGSLTGVIERAAVVVSGDSGPMHLSVALGSPTVAIHGPTDPAVNGPFKAQRAEALWAGLACSPCYRLDRWAPECPLGHTLCQPVITPEAVIAAIERVEALP